MGQPATVPSGLDPSAVLKAAQAVLGQYVGDKAARDWTNDMLRRRQIGIGDVMSAEDFTAVLDGLLPGLAVIVGPARADALIGEIRARFAPRSA
jgi:hypothetical protein